MGTRVYLLETYFLLKNFIWKKKSYFSTAGFKVSQITLLQGLVSLQWKTLLLLFNIKHCANSFWLKGWSFFMLNSSYDKQLKYASGALGLVGLKSLKYFYREKIMSTRWKTALLLWGKVHSSVQYSGHTNPLFQHRDAPDTLFTCTFPTYLWVCLWVQCLRNLYCIWPHLLFYSAAQFGLEPTGFWICKDQTP